MDGHVLSQHLFFDILLICYLTDVHIQEYAIRVPSGLLGAKSGMSLLLLNLLFRLLSLFSPFSPSSPSFPPSSCSLIPSFLM